VSWGRVGVGRRAQNAVAVAQSFSNVATIVAMAGGEGARCARPASDRHRCLKINASLAGIA